MSFSRPSFTTEQTNSFSLDHQVFKIEKLGWKFVKIRSAKDDLLLGMVRKNKCDWGYSISYKHQVWYLDEEW